MRALELPFADGSFDAVVSTQVLEYVEDIRPRWRRPAGCCGPGGRLLVLDTDWDSIVWHTADRERMRRVLAAWEEHLADPHLPRRLPGLLREAGFTLTGRAVLPILNAGLRPDTYSAGMIRDGRGFVAGRGGVTERRRGVGGRAGRPRRGLLLQPQPLRVRRRASLEAAHYHGRVAPDFLDLPERTAKPRRAGITHVLDRGLSPLALESLLETAGEHIDLIKLGWGTAYVSRGVRDKVAICREADIAVSLGGTLLEIAWEQGRVEHYVEWLRELGIDHVEVSNGSLAIAVEDKRALIAQLAGEFTVIAEVGSKRSQDAVADEWCTEMLGDLAAGAALVIAEGRESGTVGLFDATGAVHAELVEAILHAVGQETVIFEAPRRMQQAWLLQHVGPNVNLGNIQAEDVIALETLRRGLRFETLDLLPSAVRP